MKKRMLCIIMGVMLLMLLAACSNRSTSSNPTILENNESTGSDSTVLEQQESAGLDTAVLEGYDSLSFYELLTRYAKEQIEEEFDATAKAEYSVIYEDGWDASDKLNINALNDGEKGVTYSVIIKSSDGNTVTRVNIKFFVIFYEEENLLVPRGLYLDEDGHVEEIYSKSDIDKIFKNIFKELV